MRHGVVGVQGSAAARPLSLDARVDAVGPCRAMGIASIVLGVLSVLAALGGFFVSFVPGVGSFVGAILSLGAPVLAIMGIVLGGVAMSRARSEGGETGTAVAGLIVSVVAFFPALIVALSCGLCDLLCASAMIDGRRSSRRSSPATPWYLVDSGTSRSPGLGPQPPPPPPAPDPGPGAMPSPSPSPSDPAGAAVPGSAARDAPPAGSPSTAGAQPGVDPAAPPPAFPPPPPPPGAGAGTP